MKYVIFCPIFLSNNFCQVFKSLKDSLAKYVISSIVALKKGHPFKSKNSDIIAYSEKYGSKKIGDLNHAF